MRLLTDLRRSHLRAGTKYTVSVFGMFDGGESMPLAGEERVCHWLERRRPPS